ncbi:rabankyrin-5 isoform X2 [Lepeophtheirus salmonis]|uniref:rabankyrin-5 isoform X2 n=1 Tax=Lepeophtheirus salmonis TaxID=72036 RepID=UPI003AF40127
MSDELSKVQGHLQLLRSEYVKLQNKCSALEKENALLKASHGGLSAGGIAESNSFPVRLLETARGLYNSQQYSDLEIKLSDQQLFAHKFIFKTRGQRWRGKDIDNEDLHCLDWSDLDSKVGVALIKWIYTDHINFSDYDDSFLLDLMKGADIFGFLRLQTQCETSLISSVGPHNCIRYFATAEEIYAEDLKRHCSNLISTHWNEFSKEDFSHLQGPLLYSMLKSKIQYTLHYAIKIHREDVVFLYLIEPKSAEGVNALDDNGELPLDLALRSGQKSLAQSLVEHGANVNQLNQDGVPLLNLAISRGDIFSSEFLIDNGAFSKLTSSSDGNHPLHLVAKDPQMISIASKLIAKGADINCINHSSMTPLHLCLESKNKDFFDYLTSLNDLKFEEKNINGLPPLWFALQDEDNFSFAEGLCSKGISLNTVCNSNGDSLLHLLANADLEKSCMFLINSSGCQTNLANIHGNTVLHLAAENGLLELAEALLEGPNASKEIIESQNVPDRQTPLHLAISKSHKTVVNAILAFCSTNCKEKNEATNFNLKNSFGQTPLSLALSKNLHEVAMRLIESGANVNICDSTGLTLLHLAIMDGNESGSIFLMNHGADIDMRTSNGETPLELAIANRLPIVLETLCRKGANLSSSTSTGDPPLWMALQASLDLAHVLLRYGVDTDSWSVGPGGCYQTLLHRAIDENMDEAAKFLIRSGCDLLSPRKLGPNGQGGEEARDMSSPLNLCCRWGQAGIVEVLLEHEAPINSRDAEGKTPIHVAIEEGDTSIINILLDHQPNLTLRDNSGVTPFASAITFKNNKAAQKILDIEPTAAEIYDSRGRNFLHTAILRKDLESVLFLISIKANIHSITQDSNRLSPLLLAVQLGNDMIVRNLLLAGASVSDVSGCGQTALHIASEHNFPLIVGILLSNGIDFTIVDNRGNNALHIAVKEGHSEVVRTLLLESQIDAEALNNKGRNPLHILANFGGDSSSKIFDIFLKYMHDYPIDKPDAEGNTPLLLAYMKGNGNLCRSLVKNGAILGSINHDGVSLFNYKVATKQLLFKLLDCLDNEPKWGEGDVCQECSEKFGLTKRKHHCRHCGRLLCSKCSDKHMPILKYNLPKPVRVCDVCADILTIGPVFTT